MSDQLARSAAVWGMADYPQVAERLMPAAGQIASALGDGHGKQAVDVGAGTGNVAECLVERGWTVHATDLSPAMVDLGRVRTGPAVAWDVAAAEQLPLPTAFADAVVSSFGLIFAAGVDEALREVRRVLRPGGVLVFTAWPVDGYMAAMTDVMLRHLPGAPDPSPMRWGDPAIIATRLHAFTDVTIQRWTLPWTFDSPSQGRTFYERSSPAHAAAMAALGPAEATAMMDDVEAHLATHTAPGGHVRIAAEYLLVSARTATGHAEGSMHEG